MPAPILIILVFLGDISLIKLCGVEAPSKYLFSRILVEYSTILHNFQYQWAISPNKKKVKEVGYKMKVKWLK